MKVILCLLCLLPAAVLAASVEDPSKKVEPAEPAPVEEAKDEVKAPTEDKKDETVVPEAPQEATVVANDPAVPAPVVEEKQPQPQQQPQTPVAAEGEKDYQLSQAREESLSRQSHGQQPGPSNRQNSGSPLFGNLLQPVLNPGTFLSNLLPGRNSERRQIGETCQYSSDCLAGTDNSVCFNGTCLCNLGYRYTADSKVCTPVDTCPSCPADSCSSGTDVYCNGTCIRNMKAITIKGLGETGKMMLTSPNWPENYPAGTDVYYCVSASVGRRVNIQFDWMDLETNCGYNCDYVRVYNGCVGKPSELVALFHGDNARSRECVTSTCNQMLVHFHTDPNKGGRGDERSGFMGFIREATYSNDLCNQCTPSKK